MGGGDAVERPALAPFHVVERRRTSPRSSISSSARSAITLRAVPPWKRPTLAWVARHPWRGQRVKGGHSLGAREQGVATVLGIARRMRGRAAEDDIPFRGEAQDEGVDPAHDAVSPPISKMASLMSGCGRALTASPDSGMPR